MCFHWENSPLSSGASWAKPALLMHTSTRPRFGSCRIVWNMAATSSSLDTSHLMAVSLPDWSLSSSASVWKLKHAWGCVASSRTELNYIQAHLTENHKKSTSAGETVNTYIHTRIPPPPPPPHHPVTHVHTLITEVHRLILCVYIQYIYNVCVCVCVCV